MLLIGAGASFAASDPELGRLVKEFAMALNQGKERQIAVSGYPQVSDQSVKDSKNITGEHQERNETDSRANVSSAR